MKRSKVYYILWICVFVAIALSYVPSASLMIQIIHGIVCIGAIISGGIFIFQSLRSDKKKTFDMIFGGACIVLALQHLLLMLNLVYFK